MITTRIKKLTGDTHTLYVYELDATDNPYLIVFEHADYNEVAYVYELIEERLNSRNCKTSDIKGMRYIKKGRLHK